MMDVPTILRIRSYIAASRDCVSLEELAELTDLKVNVVLEYMSYMTASKQIEEFTKDVRQVYCLSERICVTDVFLREVSDAVCIRDANGHSLWHNSSFTRLASELQTRNLHDLTDCLSNTARYGRAECGRMPKDGTWAYTECFKKTIRFTALPVLYNQVKAVMLCIPVEG